MNTKEEKLDLENDWKICALKNCANPRVNLLSPSNIVLDYVKAHNVELLVRFGKRTAKISLNGVPAFLVDAFAWLEKNDAYRIDGIFRKEGNANRLKNAWEIYCGLNCINESCNVHDVCSLIKRFFREIKTPIFTENQVTILKFAESLRGTILVDAMLSVIERLPSSHFSTIAFLMKQLKKVSEYSNNNQMNVENLATVFAPSLFRDDNLFDPSVKKKRDAQFRLMNFVRSRNGLQISVVKTLIEKSYLLGSVQEHHYSQQQYRSEQSKEEVKDRNLDEVLKEPEIFEERKLTEKELQREMTDEVELKIKQLTKVGQQTIVRLEENERDDEEMFSQELEDKENIGCLVSCTSLDVNVNKTEAKGDFQTKAEDVLATHSHKMFPRRTREYKSEKEMICTYCDMRGHLCKACPNV